MNMAAIGFCCIDVYENIGKRYATGNGVDCIVHLARRGIFEHLIICNDFKLSFLTYKGFSLRARNQHIRSC